MKRKNICDLIISFLLVSSLAVTIFIVSCSDQNNIISSFNSDQSSPYHQHIHGKEELFNAAMTSLFESTGQMAANQLESAGIGWAFGAMGLTSQSPDYTSQLNAIIQDLGIIINSINETNVELAEIEQILSTYNCDYEQGLISSDITAISTLYSTYQNYVYTANSTHDTIPNSDMASFANIALNGTSTNVSIPTALQAIWNNFSAPAGTNVINSCIDTTLISAPRSGTFREDSVYYARALNVLYYYYYWQTIGLGLLSEAYHYNAWVAAGRPGSKVGFGSDSVQLICSDSSNFNVQFNCNAVIQASNNVYNSLLTQFQSVGAPYTGDDLLYQKGLNGENIVWVRSLEDYTSQSGAACNYPLNITNVCGPTSGKFGSTLSHTTYYGTQNFTFPGYFELNGLVNPTPTSSGTIGNYLDSLGFENMNVNPPKILIADTLVKLTSTGHDFNYYIDTMSVIPYISPGYPVFTVEDSHGSVYKRAIYSELYDFIGYSSVAQNVAMRYTGYEVLSNSSGCLTDWRKIQTTWVSYCSPSPWGGGCSPSGSIVFCQDWDGGNGSYNIDDFTPFSWSPAPGWSYYSANSNPQNAFFIPVRKNFTNSDGCVSYSGPLGLTNYNNFNSQGVVTKCGTDFQDFISVNFPTPSTCSSQIVVCYGY